MAHVSKSLVVDIGGTNTRVSFAQNGTLETATIKRFLNEDFSSPYAVVDTYLAEFGHAEIFGIAVDVAGPVSGEIGRLTNLDWQVSQTDLRNRYRVERAAVLNDLQAQAYGLAELSDSDIDIVRGTPDLRGPKTKLVVNVGTGFNAAPVVYQKGRRLVTPSECGHTTLPVTDETNLALSHTIKERHGFAAVEDVLSGRGVDEVYAFLCGRSGEKPELKGKDILEAANSGDEISRRTVDLLTKILGQYSGDLGLVYLPFGGIFFVGGVVRILTGHFEQAGFLTHFEAKGRFAPLLEEIPIATVTNDYAGLMGCASYLHETTQNS